MDICNYHENILIVDTANPIFYYLDWAELMMLEPGGYHENIVIVDTANPIFYYSDWAELMMSESGGYLQLS